MAKYNGHKNYETWVTRLWADNEESTYNFLHELALQYEGNVNQLADALKDWHEETYVPDNASLVTDLIRASFSEVDWHTWAADLINVNK
jgi:hypothetical protein